jgi:hypothetical protein
MGCICCTCKDCRCQVILQKGGGRWDPAPIVICKKNKIHGKYIFIDSVDCGGTSCEKQQGCTTSKICLKKTHTFKFRVWGQLETLRSDKHIGRIQYRKIYCNKKPGKWKKVVEISSKADGKKCCKNCECDECLINLPRGRYEIRFTADSVDEIDHCENYLVYDVKWCPKVKGQKQCCPDLPKVPECERWCCSGFGECVEWKCDPICVCPPGIKSYCLDNGWQVIDCESVRVV